MLLDANLSNAYWAEAVNTAAYTVSQKSQSDQGSSRKKTPFEAWYGKKPNVEHLKVFGCMAYAHIPKDECGKFDSKACKCVLLGYDEFTKGYRLYDPQSKKIIYSRDVRFDEQPEDTVIDCKPEQNTDRLISVDCDDAENDDTDDHEHSDYEQPPQLQESLPQLRGSNRTRRSPIYYGQQIHLTTDVLTCVEAINDSIEKERWKSAMQAEMDSLAQNDVWDLVELPSRKKEVGSKWVFKKKVGADGKVKHFKARLVAQGFTQKYGDDYNETFCPVVRLGSLRTMLALAMQHDLELHQVDVTTAFLNGTLEEEVFMKQPEGFIVPGSEKCRLMKSIYGLKQSPRCWNLALDSKLKEIGFSQSSHDPCTYYKKEIC